MIESTLTVEQNRYVALLQEKLKNKKEEDDFDIAISIKLDFLKGNSIEAIGVKYSPEGIAVVLSDEDIKARFPLTYKEIIAKCRIRYVDFKCGKQFNEIMKRIKQNNKIAHERQLDPDNPKSPKKIFYNGGIMKEFDKYYTKK